MAKKAISCIFIFTSLLAIGYSTTAPNLERLTLLNLLKALYDSQKIIKWDTHLVSPCDSWHEVTCRNEHVVALGPTIVANTLHAATILLRDGGDWDWFINLCASDYPLVTQDDLLHTFSSLPRELNFIDYTSDIGWKESQRAKPIIVDPGLYMTKQAYVFWVTQRRSVPTAFKLYRLTEWMSLQLYKPADLQRNML